MPTIIRDLPYFDQPTRVQVRGRWFSVAREQTIVWIGITEEGIQDLDPRTPCFPAILDIGCNYNLLINEQHLTGWAGIQPGYLRQLVRYARRWRARVAPGRECLAVSQRAGQVRRTCLAPAISARTLAGYCRVPGERRSTPVPAIAALGSQGVSSSGPADRDRLPSLACHHSHASTILAVCVNAAGNSDGRRFCPPASVRQSVPRHLGEAW